MGKALYRKYRSKSLSEIIGQEHITDVLSSSLKQGKISHAYLFTGPRGTGKTSVARILAHAINDFPYELEDDHLDILEIDAASNTGVDNIRDLRERALVAPSKGKYKVYIIDEVHMLSKSAFNALLKTLEEPPSHVVFIMATTDAHKVPITITSRSQQFVFRLADRNTMKSHLRTIADSERIDIEDDALIVIAKRGGGSFRDSISLLDQISTLTSDKITTDLINKALGLPSDELIVDLLAAHENSDQTKILESLKQLEATSTKPDLIAEELLRAIIENPTSTNLSLISPLTEVPRSPFPSAKLLLALLNGVDQPKQQVFSKPPQSDSPTRPGSNFDNASSSSANLAGEDNPAKFAGENDEVLSELHRERGASEEEVSRKPAALASPESFSWNSMLESIREKSLPLHSHLSRLEYVQNEKTLTIYTRNKFTLNILEKPTNKSLITEHTGDLELRLIPEPKPASDEKLSQISDILGNIQEVQIDTDVF